MYLVQSPVSTMSSTSTPREAAVDLIHELRPADEGDVKLVNTIDTDVDVMCCRFNEEGSLLATGLINGTIKVYSTDTGNCIYSLSDQETLTGHLPVTCLRWKPATEDQTYGNILLATYADGKVKHWHVSSSKCLSTVTENRQVLACTFNRSVDRFVTAGSDPKLYVYDERTKQVINTLEPSSSHLVMDGHMMRVFVTQYVPGDDNVFVTAGWDDTVQFWDTRVDNKHSVKKIFGPHICGDALDIMPGSLNIVTGSWRQENTLQTWDYGSSKLIKNIPADFNKSMLYCVQWQGADGIITGGSDSNLMRCVDHSTEHTTGRLMDLPRAVYTLDHNGKTRHPVIAVGCSSHVYMVKKL